MTNALFDCTGKVTLVTGGNSGIGLGFATGVAKMGGDIAIWARNADKNAEAKALIEAAGAGRVKPIKSMSRWRPRSSRAIRNC